MIRGKPHKEGSYLFIGSQALVTCLESGDYIQIRNAILILQGILPRFPAIMNLAPVIDKRIEKVGCPDETVSWGH